MAKHTIATKALARFGQLLDSSFPSGAFVHSFGLEPHIALGQVTTIEKLQEFLEKLIMYQYQGLEFVFISKVYGALQKESLPLLIREDRNFTAMASYAFAKASCDIGRNYTKQIAPLSKELLSQDYFNAVQSGTTSGNELAVLACYAFELGIEKELFTLLWCKKSLSNIAAAALKISRIQPSQIQQMLFGFDDTLEVYIEQQSCHYSNFNPLFEEVIYQHQNLEPKLFVT